MAGARAESKSEKIVESSSVRIGAALTGYLKVDLQKALASPHLALPVPLEVQNTIISYLIPDDIKIRVNAWKNGSITSAVLGRELLAAFSYPDAKMAFALDELTPEERKRLLEEPDFPILLKFYYLSTTELQKMTLPIYQKTGLALTFGLLTKGLDAYPELEEYNESMKDNLIENFKKDHLVPARIAETEINEIFDQLCRDNPPLLINNLFVKYTRCYISKCEHRYIYPILLKKSPFHLNLADEDFSFSFHNVDLPDANLRNTYLLEIADVNLRGADLRGAEITNLVRVDLENADLRGAKTNFLLNTRGTSFLNAKLDGEMKTIIQGQRLVWKAGSVEIITKRDKEFTHFQPIVDYLNKYKKRVSWDIYVHALRVMKAKTTIEFELLKNEIPEVLTQPAKPGCFTSCFGEKARPNPFNEALEQVRDNFLKLEVPRRLSKSL